MKKLAELGPFTRGSLVTAQRGGHRAHQLTVSVQGKTHTVYVPKDMIGEVKEWIKNYGRLQRIIKEVSLAYVPEARIGEYVIVHVGFAISKVDEAEAMKVFEYLDKMGELEELEADQS